MAVNPRNFLLSTDYPIDKIVGVETGSVTIPAFDFVSEDVAHGLGFTPLFYGKWSTTSNFTVSYEGQWFSPTSVLNTISFQTSSTNLHIFTSYNNSSSPVTLYYRVLYFVPPDVSANLSATAEGTFQLNSDFNYTKILDEGKINSGSGTITHNLGYRPQVEAWYIRSSDNRCIRLDYSFPENPGRFDTPEVEVTTTQVIFHQSQGAEFTKASAYYYKIYADEI